MAIESTGNADKSLWRSLKPDWASLEEIVPRGRGKALDIGAGRGRNRKIIEDAGYEWIGCDIERFPDIVVADAHHLPFQDDSFDLVVLWQVMEYLEDPRQAMREIERILVPGGIVVGSISFLEPMHGKVYFNISQYGMEMMLVHSNFDQIIIKPGIGCLPLIGWTWIRQLSGSDVMARTALWVMRVSVWMISLLADGISSFRELTGSGHGSKSRWIRERYPYDYAGQLMFRASKRVGD